MSGALDAGDVDESAAALVLFERGLALVDAGSAGEAIAAWAELIDSYWEAAAPDVRELVARALFAKADTLRRAGRVGDALIDLERLDARFGGPDEPAGVALRAANGLICRALALQKLGRPEDEIAAYEALVDRYAGSPDKELRRRVARALFNKALTLRELKRDEDVVATYARLDAQFSGVDEPPRIVELVSKGLLNRAWALDRLGRYEEEIEVYYTLATRYSDSTDPEVRGRVARALYHKALTLRELNRDEDALAAFELLDAQFAGVVDSAAVVRLVSEGLMNRAHAMDRLGRHEEEIQLYDMLATRYGDSTDPEVRGRVAHALYNKAITLKGLSRLDEAISTYEELDTRYGGPDEPAEVSEHVAGALLGKGSLLYRLGCYEDELQVYDTVVSRYGDAIDDATLDEVTRALHAKATTLWILERHDEALAVLDELLARLGGSSEPSGVKKTAEALDWKGRILSGFGRFDEGLAAFDKAIETLEGLSLEDRSPSLVEILYYKAEALRSAERTAEALVLFNSAIATYRDWSAHSFEITATSKATLALALLRKIGILGDTGQAAAIRLFIEPLLSTIGSPPLPEEPYQRVALADSELAALLAETHAGDCWFQFATAEDDYLTRDRMADRAVDLYLRTLPWILDSLEPDEDDDDDQDEEIRPFLSAMTLRSIADGYALLSISTINRANLPLPTLGLFEYVCQRFGIDEWAAQNGHPMSPPEPTEPVEQLLNEERTKALEQLDTDETDLERKFISSFSVAAWSYHVLSLLATQIGREAMRDQRLKGFAVTQIAHARQWATWANHCMDDAAPVAVTMLLMAEALYLTSHANDLPGAHAHLSQAALRELLDDTDALEWLKDREPALPPWLVAEEDG